MNNTEKESLFMNSIYLMNQLKNDNLGGVDKTKEPEPNAIISSHYSYSE